MSVVYDYEDYKEYTFSDSGQRDLILARDFASEMLRQAGAVRCNELMSCMKSGDSWQRLSVIDRLVELGEIRQVNMVEETATQYRVFVSARSH